MQRANTHSKSDIRQISLTYDIKIKKAIKRQKLKTKKTDKQQVGNIYGGKDLWNG